MGRAGLEPATLGLKVDAKGLAHDGEGWQIMMVDDG
jgi:hypothetical protein